MGAQGGVLMHEVVPVPDDQGVEVAAGEQFGFSALGEQGRWEGWVLRGS